jgi:hypothetical protein
MFCLRVSFLCFDTSPDECIKASLSTNLGCHCQFWTKFSSIHCIVLAKLNISKEHFIFSKDFQKRHLATMLFIAECCVFISQLQVPKYHCVARSMFFNCTFINSTFFNSIWQHGISECILNG